MAIVIEEERKSSSGLITILIWIVIFGVIAAAVYYIFFTKPQLVEISVPANFENTDQLSKVKLTPEDIINNPDFVALKPYITLPPAEKLGRANPFMPF